MNRLPVALIFYVLLAVICGGCGVPRRVSHLEIPAVGHPAVRVLLPFSKTEYTVEGSGRFTVRGVTTSGGEVTYYCSRPVDIKYRHGRWSMAEEDRTVLESDLRQLTINNKDPDDCLSIDGKPYLGSLSFYPPLGNDQPPPVINCVHIDDYLLGVLPPELGQRTANEFEAIKAQAVAARTYALSHLGQYTDADYDLRADHHDQVYTGLQNPDAQVTRAVEETRGEILRHRGNLIEAYYHSTCGGYTDGISAVWGKEPMPYLVATEDDTFCRWSKYYTWTETWDGPTLRENLLAFLKANPDEPLESFEHILSMRTAGRTAGGRIRTLVIRTDRGHWEIPTDRIRWALGRPSTGGPILQSARFEIRPEYDQNGHLIGLTAQGRGYGHGVGMCQCGMIGRARAGQNYRQILAHYYSGVTIEKTY